MRHVILGLVCTLTACAAPVGWQEPTDAAIAAWNLAYPAEPLTSACVDRVRSLQFTLGSAAELSAACGDDRGVSGCVDWFDADNARAWILEDERDNWRVYAHEALHVAHACAERGDLDGHHRDGVLWQHDPSDALHI